MADESGVAIDLTSLGDLGQAETLGKFSADGKIDVNKVVKSYIELEKMHGNSVKIPGEDASVEEIQAFRKRLGVPDDVTGYEVDLSNAQGVGKTTTEAFLKRAHELGMSKAHVKEVLGFVGKDMPAMIQALHQAETEKTTNALKEEWGDDFEKNLLDAKRARDEIAAGIKGGDSFVKLMNDRPELGNNPVMAKMFFEVSKVMKEGKFIGSKIELSGEDIDKRIMDIEVDPAYFDRNHPKWEHLQKERARLYKVKYPGQKK